MGPGLRCLGSAPELWPLARLRCLTALVAQLLTVLLKPRPPPLVLDWLDNLESAPDWLFYCCRSSGKEKHIQEAEAHFSALQRARRPEDEKNSNRGVKAAGQGRSRAVPGERLTLSQRTAGANHQLVKAGQGKDRDTVRKELYCLLMFLCET